jgi:PiT family inorganic phosphate transporter
MFAWISGLFLGWSLGANDTANCFGTAVASRMLAWRVAALLAALCVVLGALTQGAAGIDTLVSLAPAAGPEDASAAAREALAAAFTVALLTLLGQPVSTSHAVVGALVGSGLLQGELNLAGLEKVVICWLATPLGAMLAFVVVYHGLIRVCRHACPSLFALDTFLRGGLVLAGCYAAYALGANNVANVAVVFVRTGRLAAPLAALVGGLAMAAGALTFSRRVMLSVGGGVARIGSVEALAAVLAMAVTVHVFAHLGVPVSTSHALVGALAGLGLVRGWQVLRWPSLGRMALAWLLTPLLAAGLNLLFFYLAHLQFAPGPP